MSEAKVFEYVPDLAELEAALPILHITQSGFLVCEDRKIQLSPIERNLLTALIDSGDQSVSDATAAELTEPKLPDFYVNLLAQDIKEVVEIDKPIEKVEGADGGYRLNDRLQFETSDECESKAKDVSQFVSDALHIVVEDRRWEQLSSRKKSAPKTQQPVVKARSKDPRQATNLESITDLDEAYKTVSANLYEHIHNQEGNTGFSQMDPVHDYLEGFGRYPTLTPQEEVILARVIDRGQKLAKTPPDKLDAQQAAYITQSRQAKELFTLCNVKLVVSVAKRYAWSGIPLRDLSQTGMEGLDHAIDMFDYSKGFKFSTYATWWIRQVIGRSIENDSTLVRLPARIHDCVRAIMRGMNQYEARHGVKPNYQELAEVTGFSPEKVEKYIALDKAARNVRSFDDPVKEDSDTTLGEIITTNMGTEIDDAVTALANNQALQAAFARLDGRQMEIIKRRFYEGMTCNDIAQQMGLTESSVRSIERAAIFIMRKVLKPMKGEATYA